MEVNFLDPENIGKIKHGYREVEYYSFYEYIGMTSRKLKVRIKELMLTRLNQKQNIQVNFEDAKIIYPSKNYHDLIIRESIEIITKLNTVCNDVLSYNIPRIWLSLLKES